MTATQRKRRCLSHERASQTPPYVATGRQATKTVERKAKTIGRTRRNEFYGVVDDRISQCLAADRLVHVSSPLAVLVQSWVGVLKKRLSAELT